MIKKNCTAVLLLTLTCFASADDRLDRMAAIGEEMSAIMYQGMIAQLEAEGVDASALRSMIPDTSWTDGMREAATCVLDRYDAKIGASAVDTMLDNMESMLPRAREGGLEAIESLMSLQPEGMSDEEAVAISQSCGMMQAMQESSMAGDFMSEVMKLMGGQ